MKALLAYPEYPNTFWSFTHALKFISKKAANPPLGLLTIASMFPKDWEVRLVDMNVEPLRDKDILWADYVFVSAMVIQKKSADELIERCRALGAKVVAGGPHFTSTPEEYDHVDHLILGEAELTFAKFLEDAKGGSAGRVYQAEGWADMADAPAPDWSLLKMNKYASMSIQYSRGCPYNCEFCNITALFGRQPRTKGAGQILGELEGLYHRGWRSGVFIVDDNFIGNRRKIKQEVLPAIIQWMEEHGRPFSLSTEVSIDLADDEELMDLMVRAGFDTVFIGIESPNDESLQECSKFHNKKRDMLACVKKMQRSGFQVQGGFILGFDSDPAGIFDRVISFIQESGITTAMVGLLNAPRGTRLFQRLKSEGRLLRDSSGDNTDCSINFVPKMNMDDLMEGYRKVVQTIYSPKHYYSRVMRFIREYELLQDTSVNLRAREIKALLRSMLYLGVLEKERFHYWKLFLWSLFTRPRLFPLAITLSIYGFHFRKISERIIY
jgi:radical SAM superfamily enzyme YgiQ (UPF0313 family)